MGDGQKSLSFEQGYSRLEEILEKLNGQQLNLNEAMALYEEADRLIALCNKQLGDAESKIQILLKNRSGDLQLDEKGKPVVEPFAATK